MQLLSRQWRPDLILQSMFCNPFVPLGLRVGDGRFQGPGHLEDVCEFAELLTQNTTGWQLIEQKCSSHSSGGYQPKVKLSAEVLFLILFPEGLSGVCRYLCSP